MPASTEPKRCCRHDACVLRVVRARPSGQAPSAGTVSSLQTAMDAMDAAADCHGQQQAGEGSSKDSCMVCGQQQNRMSRSHCMFAIPGGPPVREAPQRHQMRSS